jgi:hypothetical protein
VRMWKSEPMHHARAGRHGAWTIAVFQNYQIDGVADAGLDFSLVEPSAAARKAGRAQRNRSRIGMPSWAEP